MPPNRLRPPVRPDTLVLLNRLFLNQYHMRVVTLFGGEPGLESPDKLAQVMIDARAAAGDDLKGDVFEVAATYALGLARGVFMGGNLQLATVAMATMITLNGYEFAPASDLLVETMKGVAAGSIDRAALVNWLRDRSRKLEDEAPADPPPPG